MAERTTDTQEHWYECGWCGLDQYSEISQENPVPCINCGWVHREIKRHDIPSEIKTDLNRYG